MNNPPAEWPLVINALITFTLGAIGYAFHNIQRLAPLNLEPSPAPMSPKAGAVTPLWAALLYVEYVILCGIIVLAVNYPCEGPPL